MPKKAIINETKIMSSVASVVDFIKNEVARNLHTAVGEKMITIDEKELNRTINLVQASITSAFSRGSNEIINTIKTMK